MAKKIGVLCEQFFKMDGSDSLFGGGERLFYDFVALLKQLGYDVDCYQFSTKTWTKRYKRLTIKGLGNISTPINMQQDYTKGLQEFYKINENSDGIFLLSMNLSLYISSKVPILSYSHGLMFDGAVPGGKQNYRASLDAYKTWIKNATHTISVDTNSIKVMQVTDREVAAKMSFIPNYVDLTQFSPNEKLNNDEFIVLFPRRLQWCRGYTTMMAAIDVLREKYSDMKFIFCGRGNQQEEFHFNTWYKNNPTNVEYMWKEMNDMPNVYKKATISCIPTTMAEGSSLSCLESIASGVPPIATVVGGLTDIVQDGVNGKLILPDYNTDISNPNPTTLIEGIEYMYHNREHLTEMRENGLRMIKHFSKERWDRDTAKIIKQVFGEP